MFKIILVCLFVTKIQCDLTNLNEFLTFLGQNQTVTYPIGFMTKANVEVAKRYLPGNIEVKSFDHKDEIIKALDEEKIIGKQE